MRTRGTAIVLLASTVSGCTVAAGIFKAGFWVGLILAIVLFLAIRMLSSGRR